MNAYDKPSGTAILSAKLAAYRAKKSNMPYNEKILETIRAVSIHEYSEWRPTDVLHLLTDYRNGNEILARRVMDRSKAHSLNERLSGTGLGWNVKTGY